MANVTTSAEDNLIVASDMKKVREQDFVRQFEHTNLNKLLEVLGVTRKIAMMEGTTLYVYTVEGTLADGAVPEGEIIPLSEYEQTKTAIGEITLNKWRKATSAEAIKKSGLNAAVRDTDAKMLRDVQAKLRSDLFSFMKSPITGQSTASGKDFQSALANAWAQLQIKFEDDSAEPVYFVNPLDIASYLGNASITTQTAFGMNYIEDFLGLGTVIISAQIPQGTFVATAKENFVMYYLTMNGDIAGAFDLTTDATGYIGINSGTANKERAQVETLVIDGIKILVEYAAGVVKGVLGADVTLDIHETEIAVAGTKALTATTYPAGATVTWDSSDSTIASVSSGTVTGVKAGTCEITASITVGTRTATDSCKVTVNPS